MRAIAAIAVLLSATVTSALAQDQVPVNDAVPSQYQGTWVLPWEGCKSPNRVVIGEHAIDLTIGQTHKHVTGFDTSRSCYGRNDPDGHMFCLIGQEGSQLYRYTLIENDITGDLIVNSEEKPHEDMRLFAQRALMRCN